ncbi:MAG: exonuclease subunit SbcD [Thermodesulfobacteriota bacterium]
MKLLHLADTHISDRRSIAGKVIERQGLNLALFDTARCLDVVINYVRNNGIDLVLYAGDVFDFWKPTPEEYRLALETVTEIAKHCRIVIIPGNHDVAKSGRSHGLIPFKYLRNPNLFFSDIPEIIDLDECQVFTLPYPTPSLLRTNDQYKNLTIEELNGVVSSILQKVLRGFEVQRDEGRISIILGHITVAGAMYSESQIVPMHDISIPKKCLTWADYVALGHLHLSQEFYPGSINREGFGDEKDLKGFRVVTIEKGKESLIEFIETPARSYRTFTLNEFVEFMAEKPEVDKETIVRIKDEVTKEEYEKAKELFTRQPFTYLQNSVVIAREARRRSKEATVDMTIDRAIENFVEVNDQYREILGPMKEKAKLLEARLGG